MVAGSGRRDAIALVGGLVLVAVPVWIVREIRTSDSPVNTATVYAAYLAAAAPALTLLAFLVPWWWKGRRVTAVPATAAQVMAAADQFAQRMLSTWRQEAKERRISTPAPVRVRWQWAPHEVAPPPTQVTTAPLAGTGPRPLPKPDPDEPHSDRLGVLLEAGVVTRLHDEVYCQLPHGRLVLVGGPGAGKSGAMVLLLLATLEHRRSVSEAQRGEVPVPVWLTLGGWNPTTQTLHQWAAATMYRDHPYLRAPDYGPDAAGELLRAGRVALFLDGLDEMAPAAQHQALARVEQEGAGLRIVLNSRPTEYRHAVSGERLHNTAVITLQPVDPGMARAYLVRDQIGAQHDRWAQVGNYLTQHPDSVVANALNNPLTLSLARATYQDQDPTPLTDPARFRTMADLREHLLERVLIVAYPDERQRAHATRWLAWIAHHMGSDLRDLAWWHIPTWIPRWQFRLAVGLVGGLAVGLVVGLAVGLMDGLMDGLRDGPMALFPRWPRPRELLGLLRGGLGAGLALGLGAGLAGGLKFGLGGGLAFGLAGWLGGWLAVGLGGLINLWLVPLPRAATATPTSTYRIDRRTSTVLGLTVGLAVGLTAGLTAGLAAGLAEGSMPKVGLTEHVLAVTGAGRVNFMKVLEDAHRRQVLRQAGAVYQFRHADLQKHLAKIHR